MSLEYESKQKWIILAVVAVVVLGGMVYFVWPKAPASTQPIACTQEAKICPDGSAVGRTGPNCEFAACPEANANSGWTTLTDATSGISFQYPKPFPAKYITPAEWPPKAAIMDGPFTCNETGSEVAAAGQTVKRAINNRDYCLTKQSEGAAGSTFATYTYTTAKSDKVFVLTFTLRAVQCANYEEPQKTECSTERTTFDVDSIAGRIAQGAAVGK